ncbi:MAG TPA: GAF and ANTAR domain-containing protein [Nocardioidaceae bacterium]|jgi:GAF domain-containing protein|nr:GAF and ANTAR domain-containing protein [Nocardioidaceae bacterium]
MTTFPVERLAGVFVEVADTLVADFDVVDFLHLITARAAELVPDSAVGLMLADHQGRLRFMGASTEATRLLELFQLQNDQGPCLDCFRTGVGVVNADLHDDDTPWPRFAPRAVEAGFRSVHAVPLKLRAEVIGALNVFGRQPTRLEPADAHIVQALADVATIGLMQERAIRRNELLAEQLQTALNSRIVVEQAKGALAQMHGVSVDHAFELLRAHARSTGTRLSDVARQVVTDPAGVRGLSRP